jgi:hypothetical protein
MLREIIYASRGTNSIIDASRDMLREIIYASRGTSLAF